MWQPDAALTCVPARPKLDLQQALRQCETCIAPLPMARRINCISATSHTCPTSARPLNTSVVCKLTLYSSAPASALQNLWCSESLQCHAPSIQRVLGKLASASEALASAASMPLHAISLLYAHACILWPSLSYTGILWLKTK